MNAYEKALSLGLTGTDTQIVNQLTPLTQSNITARDAVEWLTEGGYWQEGPAGMTGTLVAPYDASSGAARKKFDDCWNWLFSTSANVLKTTQVSQADRVLFLINQIPSVTAGIRNSFFALGGGRPYKDDTTITYDEQRTAAQAVIDEQAAITLMETRWANVLNGGVNAALAARDIPALIVAMNNGVTYLESL